MILRWLPRPIVWLSVWRFGEEKVALFFFRLGLKLEIFGEMLTMPYVAKKRLSQDKRRYGVIVSPTHTNEELAAMSDEELRDKRPPLMQIRSSSNYDFQDATRGVQFQYMFAGKDPREGVKNREKGIKKVGGIGFPPAEVQEQTTIEAMARFLVANIWNFEDESGRELECTFDNVLELLRNDDELREFVTGISNDASNFDVESQYATDKIAGKSPNIWRGNKTTAVAA